MEQHAYLLAKLGTYLRPKVVHGARAWQISAVRLQAIWDRTQIVNHVWLPEDLLTVRPPRADRLEIPYCRQFLTGNEKKYVDQILDNKMLDSAANYTNLCASRIKKLLNNLPVDNDTDAEEMERRSVEGESHSKEVIITQSGTAALEME